MGSDITELQVYISVSRLQVCLYWVKRIWWKRSLASHPIRVFLTMFWCQTLAWSKVRLQIMLSVIKSKMVIISHRSWTSSSVIHVYNSLRFRNDETKTGHILGNAKQRSTQGLPERQLSVVECSFTRFFTHAALFIGANIPDQVCISIFFLHLVLFSA